MAHSQVGCPANHMPSLLLCTCQINRRCQVLPHPFKFKERKPCPSSGNHTPTNCSSMLRCTTTSYGHTNQLLVSCRVLFRSQSRSDCLLAGVVSKTTVAKKSNHQGFLRHTRISSYTFHRATKQNTQSMENGQHACGGWDKDSTK